MDCGGKLRKSDNLYEIYDLKLRGFTLSVTYLKPDKSTKGHKHSYEEGYYFAGGIGRMQMGGTCKQVSAGQFVAVPPNAFHRVFNNGLLSLVFVCAWREE